MTETQLEELQQRNAERIKQVTEELGTKHLLHPVNKVFKLNKSAKVIDIKVQTA